MSIDRVNISNPSVDRSQAAQQNELTRGAGKDRPAVADSDSVALSSRAAEFTKLGNMVEDSQTARLNKVLAELAAGTYHVSAGDIAQKLIEANSQ
jgi:anti-sigma28 factor (negative regulator of flagellin synthesis)